MDDILTISIIRALQELSPAMLGLGMLFITTIGILASLYFFGSFGLVAYNVVACIIANIQVLKVVQFEGINVPIALGNIVFASTFLASDIITEHYGKDLAQKSLFISIFFQLLMISIMLITIAYKSNYVNIEEMDGRHVIQNALITIFAPSLRFVASSIIAYCISQMIDIYLFQWLRTRYNSLWLRFNVSTMVGALFDNVIFNVLAWMVFKHEHVTTRSLVLTYMLGSYLYRIFLSMCTTPIIYVSYAFVPKESQIRLPKL